jgi:RNA polymerase sigma-70 factor, ECF subfamily
MNRIDPGPSLVHCLVARGTDPVTVAAVEGEIAAALSRAIPVSIEKRARARRRATDRRTSTPSGSIACRRRIRNADGRRVADRRATSRPWTDGERLARRLHRRYGHVQLVHILPGDEPQIADTLRLVVRFQSGDGSAFREIYERYFTKIYHYFISVLADRHAAEDQAQEVFVRIFRALPRYEIRGVPFDAWLFRIARNQAIDERQRREPIVVEEPDRVGRRHEAVETRSARTSAIPSDYDLPRLVEGLPLAQRQVVVLRYVVDLDWQAIAIALDKSPGAVRQIEQRAFSSLRRRLEVMRQAPGVERLPLVRRESVSPVTSRRRRALAA